MVGLGPVPTNRARSLTHRTANDHATAATSVATGARPPLCTDYQLDIDCYIEIFRYMDLEKAIAALNNPMRRRILAWLKDRSNFPPALPEHAHLEGVCVAYIQDKAGLSQSTVSSYMGVLKEAGLVISERHGQFTFYRRDEDAIRSFLTAVEQELIQP